MDGAFSDSTGVFTAPVDGVYIASFTATAEVSANAEFTIRVNDERRGAFGTNLPAKMEETTGAGNSGW